MRKVTRRRKSRLLRIDTLLLSLLIALISLLSHYYYEGELPFSKSELLQIALDLSEEPERKDYIQSVGTDLARNAPPPKSEDKNPQALRFLMYNVENYFVYGEPSRCHYILKNKSEASKDAVAQLIASAEPDVVGLIEMGGQMALSDLRTRLEKQGANYPYYRILERQGDPRALALLSKYPIIKDESRAYQGLYDNKKRRMLRGILDLEVQAQDGRIFCFIGAHLKSRAGNDQAAASSLRSKEARTIAMHIHERMRQSPKLPILVFGDWNDTPSDASLGILSQGIKASSALSHIKALDAEGGAWTYYYSKGKKYYIFDQIYLNQVLKTRQTSPLKSGLLSNNKASDHRAVWCEVR